MGERHLMVFNAMRWRSPNSDSLSGMRLTKLVYSRREDHITAPTMSLILFCYKELQV